ncbi:MAG: hypothetical protein K2Z81_16770, partial [Cyanobacteria bacterium]|nr:hypothetical protein [Cyanobacteriota bacterium]
MSNEPGQSETPSIPIRKWEILACKILYVEPVGYEVIIPKYNLRGFLLTEAKLKVGEEVLAQYMSVRNDRILLAHMEKSAQDDIQRTSDLVIRNHKINIRRATDLFVAPLTETHKFNPVQIDQIDDLLALVAELEEGQITGCIKANCEPKFSRSAVLL